ncbi:hypothetical protein AKJ42_03880, partial [candidate division MSBL1 archaeon SCGC-AAA261C02]
MLGIELIREDPEKIRKDLQKRGDKEKLAWVDELREKDEEWRKLKQETDRLKHERNVLTREIAEKKGEGRDVDGEIQKSKDLLEEIESEEEKKEDLRKEIDEKLMKLPNILHPSVPQGESDEDNEELYTVGEPETPGYSLRPHGQVL